MKFKEFIKIWESTEDEITRLEQELSQTDAKINQQTDALRKRKESLIKVIAQKRKALEVEKTKSGQQLNIDSTPAATPSNASAGII